MHYDLEPTLRARMFGEQFAAHLNHPETRHWRARLVRLLELCRELPRIVREAEHLEIPAPGRKIPKNDEPEQDDPPLFAGTHTLYYVGDKNRLVIEEINHLLDRYRFRRQMPLFVGSDSVHFDHVGIREKRKKWFQPSEIKGASLLLQLVEEGGIDRIHKCDCGQWFYATRRSQEYCQLSHRRRGERQRLNPEGQALYQAAYRRQQRIEQLTNQLSRRMLSSERQQMRREIAQFKQERKTLLEQRRKVLNAKK